MLKSVSFVLRPKTTIVIMVHRGNMAQLHGMFVHSQLSVMLAGLATLCKQRNPLKYTESGVNIYNPMFVKLCIWHYCMELYSIRKVDNFNCYTALMRPKQAETATTRLSAVAISKWNHTIDTETHSGL